MYLSKPWFTLERKRAEKAMKQAVAYYRVSTQRQGKSGLGLDAQQSAIKSYCLYNGYALIDEVVEIKSTRRYQIRLWEAMESCQRRHAALFVARLDRLGRDVEQIARLVKSNVEIIVTDNPNATRLTIHILAAVAEDQRQRISETTREALAAAKRRGAELGRNGKRLAMENKRAAEEFAASLVPTLDQLKNKGITSIRAISQELNRRRVPSFTGGQWHPNTVYTLLRRLKPHHS